MADTKIPTNGLLSQWATNAESVSFALHYHAQYIALAKYALLYISAENALTFT